MYSSLSLYLSFFGHVMYPHHADQMSQRSQVSRIALWWSSLNVFVFVIVFVFIFAFVNFLVKSCLLITLIKCRTGQKFLGLLLEGILKMSLLFVNFLVMSCLLITLTNCLKGHKSLGLLVGGVLKMSLSLFLSIVWSCHVFSPL